MWGNLSLNMGVLLISIGLAIGLFELEQGGDMTQYVALVIVGIFFVIIGMAVSKYEGQARDKAIHDAIRDAMRVENQRIIEILERIENKLPGLNKDGSKH
jgi:hypothetical protein